MEDGKADEREHKTANGISHNYGYPTRWIGTAA
jgi:hypothetical protein